MFDSFDFMNWLGFSRWVDALMSDDVGSSWSFSDLVFNTLPAVLQLFVVVFVLNWIMGIIADVCHIGSRGGKI